MITLHPTGSRQRGAALIMALLVVGLAAALSTTLLWRQDVWLRQVEMQRDLAQTRLIADAGIEWGRAVLAYDGRTSTSDNFNEAWAIKVPNTSVEGGEIGGEMTDEQGKWNLNNLLSGDGSINAGGMEVFRRLLQLLQLPPALAPTLADWLDSDDETAPGGAEDDYYLKLSPPYRAANRPLTDVDALRRVRGFDAAVVERLRPHVTALPGYHSVNVNTASEIVLAAVLPQLSSAEIRTLIAMRKAIPFKDFGDFRSRLPRPEVSPNPEQLDTRSRYFSIRIRARYERASVVAEALLDRQGTGWPAMVWQKYE